MAQLAGGVAVIRVGAATEIEMKEKKLRIEDALAATKAAVEEGIVAGGGVALIDTIPAVAKLLESVEGDEKTGVQIVLKALEEPVRQIAANAGVEGSVIVENLQKESKVCLLYTSLLGIPHFDVSYFGAAAHPLYAEKDGRPQRHDLWQEQRQDLCGGANGQDL